MKKIFTCILLFIATLPTFSQIILEEHFDTYHTQNPPVAPAGWFISWNPDTSSGLKSYYYNTSPTYQFCGISCPTYKFGDTSDVYILTPAFANADSVRFYLKGNGTYAANRFQVWGGMDTTTMTLIQSIDSISPNPVTIAMAIPPGVTNLKFIYFKDFSGYNAGFDDVYIYAGAFPTAVSSVAKSQLSIYPNPSRGGVQFDFNGMHPKNVSLTFNNVLGMQIKKVAFNGNDMKYQVDLSEFPDGVYFVKVKSDFGETTQRIVLRKS